MQDAVTVHDALSNLILDNRPESLLVISDTLPDSLKDFNGARLDHISLHDTGPEDLIQNASKLHADFVLVFLPDSKTGADSKSAFETVLGSLRNQLNSRICVFAGENSALNFQDFIALGFRRLLHCHPETDGESDKITVYSYAIASYNHIRSWNNSRFWANPELFGLYWW